MVWAGAKVGLPVHGFLHICYNRLSVCGIPELPVDWLSSHYYYCHERAAL